MVDLYGGETKWLIHSQYSHDKSHHKQQIASASQQGEESSQVRTDAYHHDSVGFTVQNRDEEARISRQARIAACLSWVERSVPSGSQAGSHDDFKDKGQ